MRMQAIVIRFLHSYKAGTEWYARFSVPQVASNEADASGRSFTLRCYSTRRLAAQVRPFQNWNIDPRLTKQHAARDNERDYYK